MRKCFRIAHRIVQREVAERAWAQSGMPGRPRRPSLYYVWDQSGARVKLCTAQLDRARGEIRLTTGSDIVHSFSMRGQMRPLAGEMRFFVAVPDDRRMRRHLLSCPYRDFAELPVPFLSSTIRPAAEARTRPAVEP